VPDNPIRRLALRSLLIPSTFGQAFKMWIVPMLWSLVASAQTFR